MRQVCGLDVHKDSVFVCILNENGVVFQEKKGVLTTELEQMLAKLMEFHVEEVCMESTSIYWMPVWRVLENYVGLKLVNPYFIKQLPGKKSDVKDAEWIATCLLKDLIKGSYVPEDLIQQLRQCDHWSPDEVAQSSPSSAYGLYFSKSGSSGSMASAVSTKNSVRCVKEQSPSANDYVDKSGVNWGASTKIGDVYWAPVNCGATGDNIYGSYYYFNQINTACPSGWRIPTLSEFDALSKNYSGLTSLRNIRGRWFSGPIAYSEDVAAVFLPAAGGDGKNLGTKGEYWTSSIGEDPDYHFEFSWCFEFSDSDVTSSYTPISSSSKNTYSVRCVKK